MTQYWRNQCWQAIRSRVLRYVGWRNTCGYQLSNAVKMIRQVTFGYFISWWALVLCCDVFCCDVFWRVMEVVQEMHSSNSNTLDAVIGLHGRRSMQRVNCSAWPTAILPWEQTASVYHSTDEFILLRRWLVTWRRCVSDISFQHTARWHVLAN